MPGTTAPTAAGIRAIVEATAAALRQHADMMDRGEIPMLTGPEALRAFAAASEATLQVREAEEQAIAGQEPPVRGPGA